MIKPYQKKKPYQNRSKKNTLEAKPFVQIAEYWKQENRLFTSIDRARGRRPGAKSNRYTFAHKWSNSLIRFRSSNSCFLLESGTAGHERH